MTEQRALRIFQARGDICAECGPTRKLRPGDDWDVDHIIALENGGTDEDENLQILCDYHHGLKTKDDHSTAGHGRRMAAKAFVPKRFKKTRGWR